MQGKAFWKLLIFGDGGLFHLGFCFALQTPHRCGLSSSFGSDKPPDHAGFSLLGRIHKLPLWLVSFFVHGILHAGECAVMSCSNDDKSR